MRISAATICAASLLAFGMVVLPNETRLGIAAYAADGDNAIAEEGVTQPPRHRKQRSTRCVHRQPTQGDVAPYPRTSIGEDRLKQLKQLHREERR